mgnify:CR=1 FL=1
MQTDDRMGMKERINFVHEIYSNATYFFASPQAFDEKTVKKKWKEQSPDIVSNLVEVFDNVQIKVSSMI